MVNNQQNSFSSSMVNNQQNSFSSQQQQISSTTSVQKSQQMTSQSSSSSSKSFSSMQSSNMVQKDFGMSGISGGVTFAPAATAIEPEPIEIGQDNLKTQLVSCISDLEKDRDFVDFNKENKPINLASPPQTFSPVPTFEPAPKQDTFSPGPQTKQDMFSPPPLEAMEPPKPQPVEPIQQPSLPSRNEFIQNGFSDFSASSTTQQVLNGSFEETGSVQGSSSSSSLLQKIMTPANNEYDSGSLKRRDPRKMFTDSSFYSAKHHPTVADQVEMAHKLSSAMFNEKNKSTKGQQMFLSRVQNAGEEEQLDHGDPNKMPNLKHVMNPEGRMTEWEDVTKEDLPNAEMMAAHAAPIPNTPDPIAESLLAEAGKGGELFAKRRKRAENWVVDEASIGQAKPSAFADKFVHEQTERQSQFAQEQFVARQQKEAVASQQQLIQQTESQQNQSLAKQQFSEQQQQKQQQSEELRRQ